MATIQDINTTIISGSFTNDQLNSIVDAVKFARAQIAQKNKFTLVKGSMVKFKNSRTGSVLQGSVTKVAIKFVTVNCGAAGSWRVPAHMLSAA